MLSTKKFIIAYILILTFVNQAFAQSTTCDCKADLEFLDSKIIKTPAYKRNKEAYNIILTKVTAEAVKTTAIYDCYVLLNRLLLSINDNHNRIYGVYKGAIDEIRNDSLAFSAFKNSGLFNLYPRPGLNLDSLRLILETKKFVEIEGIYKLNNQLTIGVFKNNHDDQFIAIVMDSENNVWEKGEILYTLLPYGRNYILTIGGSLSTKRLITFTERIDNGLFLKMGFAKNVTAINYATQLPADKTYFRDEISPEITYLRVGSFSGFNPTLSEAEEFYKQVEGTLNKQHLILDLRNNGGGGVRNSDILFKILKEYSKTNNIYILINLLTASNAEQFTVRLSKLDNCKVFGQQSNGTIAYELTGVNFELPSRNYKVVLTSKSHSNYLNLESVGIEPDINLDLSDDWINQLVNYITNKQ